jgi:hypothetical protein
LRPPRPDKPKPKPHDPHIYTPETPSTIPLQELRELIGKEAHDTPLLVFQYEPGIIDVHHKEDPPPSISKFTKRHHVRKMRKIRISITCQGNTGANVGATHNRRILWNYRTLATPIPIITYSKNESDVNACEAIGVGQCKTISNDNTVMYWTMLHTPESTGTILSPDKYMMDNKDVQKFSHVGNKNGTGSINFENKSGRIIAAIEMARHHDGLWYTTNPVLMPPKEDHLNMFDSTPEQPTITKTATAHQPTLAPIPETAQTVETEPKAKLPRLIQQLELWHQQMGHPAPRALYQTQRVVKGIPVPPQDNSIFRCPFCDMAKLRKANRNK